MDKAILVMDMPESCSKCKFMYEFQGIKKCQLMNVLNNGASKLSQSTFTQKRYDLCPLRELPEKREINHNKNHYISNFWTEAKNVGWNACLDNILKDDGMRKE